MKQELRDGYATIFDRFFKQHNSEPDLFITLISTSTGSNPSGIKSSFRHFYNKINRELYGQYWQKNQRRVLILPVIERHIENGYWHIHMLVSFDEQDKNCRVNTIDDFSDVCMEKWWSMKSCYRGTFTVPDWCKTVDKGSERRLYDYIIKHVVHDGEYGEILLDYL